MDFYALLPLVAVFFSSLRDSVFSGRLFRYHFAVLRAVVSFASSSAICLLFLSCLACFGGLFELF